MSGRTPRTVAVFGSCATRDNFNSRFNPDYGQHFTVPLTANQISLITMMSPPVEEGFEPKRPMSDYDIANVRADLSRDFLPQLAELKPDFLILDFFADIHFGVLELPDGRFLTDNRWKLYRTDLWTRLKEAREFSRRRIFADTEAYLALWTDALDRFAAFVREHCPETTVVVHRGVNAGRVWDHDRGELVPLIGYKPLKRIDVARANRLWARLDELALAQDGWRVIDLRKEGYASDGVHPWGPFYVHYTMDYYHRFLAELHLLDLETDLDPVVLERVRAIAAATREQAVRQSRFARKAIAEQNARIAELEGAGVASAVRRSLGRRGGKDAR